ncbi:MAG: hypothetical protein ACOH2J_20670 [Allorhizobium sp.]
MTGISSSVASGTTLASSIISLDTNGDGNVSADELEAGGVGKKRSQDPTVESDSSVTGIAAQLLSDMISAMLNKAQADTDVKPEPGAEPMSSAEIFASMDADGDGAVTQAEFVAARPDHVSEEDATKLFSQFDGEATGALSEAQFKAAMEANRPAGAPSLLSQATAAGEAVGDDSETTMSLTDLLDEMTSIIDSYRQFAADAETEASTSTSV